MTDLLEVLHAATDSLGPEHAADVRQARSALRNVYLQMRALVTGDPQFAPVDLIDMDQLDRMVLRWMRDRLTRQQASVRAAAAVKQALAGENVPAEQDA